MISGQFHQGSGLGNQLARYVATRVLAKDKGTSFGMTHPELFKGYFIQADLGLDATDVTFANHWTEKKVVENGVDIRSYDPEINFVEDCTLIEGELQAPQYFEHRLDEVREWLRVEPRETPDNLCVINFRGGEYTLFPELFLTKEYWDEGIYRMRGLQSEMKFEVHTDDPVTAQRFFPDFPVIHDVGYNWRSIRYAKYLLLSNSSFAILPALLNQDVKKIIAPRGWARHNLGNGIWAQPSNYYKQFTYI